MDAYGASAVQKTDQDQGRLSEQRQLVETVVHGHPECQQKMDHADSELEPDTIAIIDIF